MSLKYEIIDGKIVDSSGNEIKENVSVNDLYYNSNQIKEIYFNGNKCNFVGLDKDKKFYLVLGEIKHKGIGFSEYTMFKLYPDTYRTMAEIPGELLNDDGSIDLITDSLENEFASCYAITKIPKIINTNKSTNNNYMFYKCHSLLSIPKLDTSKVTDMGSMLYDCNNLTTLDVSKWDTSKVTKMDNMFYHCNNLTTLDVSGFDTSNVTNMSGIFNGCSKLTAIDVSGFDTSNVTTFGCASTGSYYDKGMFEDCGITSLDLSNWNTSKGKHMGYMFYGCAALNNLKLNFDMTSIIDIKEVRYMFTNCKIASGSIVFNNVKASVFTDRATFINAIDGSGISDSILTVNFV